MITGLALAFATVASVASPNFSEPRTIDNSHLPLTKFTRCELRGLEGGASARVVRRLLDRTEPFDVNGRRVDVAVIEDRAFEDGALVERTLDYFAQADDGTVYYLGEDVDNIENGRVTDHKGTWRYGRDTDKLGVAMPADPQVGDTWRFEDVPGVTTESNRVTRRIARLRVRGKLYRDVIEVRERIRPDNKTERKLYARGYGTIRETPPDGRVELAKCS